MRFHFDTVAETRCCAGNLLHPVTPNMKRQIVRQIAAGIGSGGAWAVRRYGIIMRVGILGIVSLGVGLAAGERRIYK